MTEALSIPLTYPRFIDESSMRPGVVGSVGDALGQVRFKQNMPEAAMRYDPNFAHQAESRLGSNVQNGLKPSFMSGGYSAELYTRTRTPRSQVGYKFQDLRVPDKSTIPVDIPTPAYSWKNKLAHVYKAKVHGDKFLPLPGGFQPQPGQVPRGGALPTSETLGGATENIVLYEGSGVNAAPGAEAFGFQSIRETAADPVGERSGPISTRPVQRG